MIPPKCNCDSPFKRTGEGCPVHGCIGKEAWENKISPLYSVPVNSLVNCNKNECKYFLFADSVTCLFAEGVEVMTKDEIYAAIRRDWKKFICS